MIAQHVDYSALAKRIEALDFDHVFQIVDYQVVDVPGTYAPSVYHDEDSDVFVDGEGWQCVTGVTCQYGYRGAVMHPSEYVGHSLAQHLTEDYPEGTAFALVVVSDLDDNEDVGWAIAYR